MIPPVNSLADDPNGPIKGQTTLRDDINQANSQGGGTIQFQTGLTGIISLQAMLPDLSTNVTIQGPGANTIVVQGNATAQNPYRIFKVDTGVTAEIDDLSIQGGLVNGDNGGGIENFGNLTLHGDTISDNQTVNTVGAGGGGVYNGYDSDLTLISTTISSNQTSGFGGGIYNGGTVSAIGTGNNYISGNTAAGWGGGIYNGKGASATLRATGQNSCQQLTASYEQLESPGGSSNETN